MLAARLQPKLTKYIKIPPQTKQQAFLLLNNLECLYGGAAGGGKSYALLMGGLQYADQPDYHALILRRTFKQLEKPGALIEISKEWLMGTDAQWNEARHKWTFPSGATLTFGHMEHEKSKYDYQGAAYSFVGFDELTQFEESQYTYLFSRVRRKSTSAIPVRVRAASNPGGIGHDWVKNRFLTHQKGRMFLPAKLQDNPGLDRDAYLQSLAELDPLTRQQLLNGDWDAVLGGRFKREWLRWWRGHGTSFILDDRLRAADQARMRFLTVDSAASVKETADYTVISAWALLRSGDLIWLDCLRGRWEIPDIPLHIATLFERHRCTEVAIEGDGNGIGVVQLCQRHPRLGPTAVRVLKTEGKDKLVRATPAINLAASGKLWLPASNPPWLDEALGELLRFTGDPEQDAHDDVVDALAYAALVARGYSDGQACSFAPYTYETNPGRFR